jgi:arylsulfatase
VIRRPVIGLFLASSLAWPVAAQPPVAPSRPNILVIVADDLGYSDIGAFGGEIDTPNLDRLARAGVRLTDFHTAPACSPTRAMLLSGSDSHRVGLGAMEEATAPNQKGHPGFEGYLTPNVATLADLLGAHGYSTMMAGKWHLGLQPVQDPHARGFQRSFAMLQASHNHFGLNASSDPTKGATYSEAGVRLEKAPDGFYSSDYFATKLIQFLDQSWAEGGKHKPFFAYLAFTAPHFPLMAPPETIAKYRGHYDAGFDVLRAERLKRQIALGIYAPGVAAHPPKLPVGGWNALTPEQRGFAARNMEVYAAMVDRLDQNVGRVIAELKRLGEYDNTVIVFLSDNGADGMDIATTEVRGLSKRVAAADNRLENRGAASSYLSNGPGWASASSAPSWLYKGYATEGGTHTPSFITWSGLARTGGFATVFAHVADIAPTLLDLAGVADPKGRFEGRAVEPIRGHSWVPYLTGRASRIHATDEAIGTEMSGSRSLRQGDWKITDTGDGQWHLFHIASDPGEIRDLATDEPDRLVALLKAWDVYARDVGIILPDTPMPQP